MINYNKMKKQELVELCESFEEEIEKAESEIDSLEEDNTEYEKANDELQNKIEDLKEEVDEDFQEKLIQKIESLDPNFNRDIDLTNNYLERVY